MVAVPARGAKPALRSGGLGEVLDVDELDPDDRLHDELGDAVAAAEPDRLARGGGDGDDLDLAAVALVDPPRRGDPRQSPTRPQPPTRGHESRGSPAPRGRAARGG